ncbi:hypothetical protein [Pedobacter yonginense]|uniref:hypothetical protein n=1 Tax=Pedobacter yonginense TaxID=651869 RepID=UPI0010577984|nr:hypothetical protein [Pedobacter yonginense]
MNASEDDKENGLIASQGYFCVRPFKKYPQKNNDEDYQENADDVEKQIAPKRKVTGDAQQK